MNTSTTSALLLAGTLAAGLVLGAAGAGALARQRRVELGTLGRPPGFARHVEDVLQPRDSAQRARLQPVIERAAARNQRIIRDANVSLRQSIDSLRAELGPLLDDAQRDRLARMTSTMPPFGPGRPRPGMQRMPGHRGPPPFGAPGDDRASPPPDDAGPPPR